MELGEGRRALDKGSGATTSQGVALGKPRPSASP